MLKRWKADTWEQQLKLRSFSPRWSCWVGDDMKTTPTTTCENYGERAKTPVLSVEAPSTAGHPGPRDDAILLIHMILWFRMFRTYQNSSTQSWTFPWNQLGQLKKGGYIRNNLRGCNGGQSQVERPCGHSTKSIFGGTQGEWHWIALRPKSSC